METEKVKAVFKWGRISIAAVVTIFRAHRYPAAKNMNGHPV